MRIYKTSSYVTKDNREITFEAIPFNENKDKRGWVFHKIHAFVDGVPAGYIKLSYIPKEKWDSIYKSVWTFRRLMHGNYVVPEELDLADDKTIQKYLKGKYTCPEDVKSKREDLERVMPMYYRYYVDKPIVDFVRVEDKFRKLGVAKALHLYANEWLKQNFGLKLWLSYSRTDAGKSFYDNVSLPLKKYRYNEPMGDFRKVREHLASNMNWYNIFTNMKKTSQLNVEDTPERRQKLSEYFAKDNRLQEILQTMIVPSLRKKDYRWLTRNLPIRNSLHKDFEEAMSILKWMCREIVFKLSQEELDKWHKIWDKQEGK